MSIWFHTTILATSIAATVAVGIASAAIYNGAPGGVAAKGDRLPIAMDLGVRSVTVEKRMDGVSVLARIPVSAFE